MADNGVIVQGELVEPSLAERIDKEVNDIIKQNTLLATGAGLIPVIGLDVAALTAVQTRMAKQIGAAYGLTDTQHEAKVIVQSLISSVFSRLSSFGIRKAFDTFSNFGTLADEITNAAIAGAVTAATGEIYKKHFSSGGNFSDMDLGHFIDYVQEKLTDGSWSPGNLTNLANPFSNLS